MKTDFGALGCIKIVGEKKTRCRAPTLHNSNERRDDSLDGVRDDIFQNDYSQV